MPRCALSCSGLLPVSAALSVLFTRALSAPSESARAGAADRAHRCGRAAGRRDNGSAQDKTEKKIERIRIEDDGTRIDELRYGGETQSITVQPKFGAPSTRSCRATPHASARKSAATTAASAPAASASGTCSASDASLPRFGRARAPANTSQARITTLWRSTRRFLRRMCAGLLQTLALGELRALRGIQGGIENTNYFVTTTRGEYVLTLFERLTDAQLPFYLQLMRHLAQRGIPAPEPVAAADGGCCTRCAASPPAWSIGWTARATSPPRSRIAKRSANCWPACIWRRATSPCNSRTCAGSYWWNATVPVVLPFVRRTRRDLLRDELALQNGIADRGPRESAARRGACGPVSRQRAVRAGRLTGVFDFYFAGMDSWLFDLSVCLNDWTIDLSTGQPDPAAGQAAAWPPTNRCGRCRPASVVDGHDAARSCAEVLDFAALGSALAARGAMLVPHDPTHFERVLRAQRAQPRAHGGLDVPR